MIFLDLDGVFADYRKGFHKVLGYDYHDNPKLSWPVLDQEPQLFRRLELLPNAREFYINIVKLAKEHDQGVAFLTACPIKTNQLRTAAEDKLWWVRNVLESPLEVICTPGWAYKKAYARIGSILIDDSARNIWDWNSVGGTGLLHYHQECTTNILRLMLQAK